MTKVKFTIKHINGTCSNGMKVGDYFTIENHKLSIPEDKKICMWAAMHVLQIAPLLMEKSNLPEDHWIHNFKTRRCPDGKVTFALDIS